MRLRARPAESNGLILLRSVFLVLVAALLLFVVPLSFIGPSSPFHGHREGMVVAAHAMSLRDGRHPWAGGVKECKNQTQMRAPWPETSFEVEPDVAES